MRICVIALLALLCAQAAASDRTPEPPPEILDSLAAAPREPLTAEMRELAAALARAPADHAAAVRLAHAYYRHAALEGDLRFIGYARSALEPWWALANPPVDIRLMRANLRQYVHAFPAALADLDEVLKRDPAHVQALALRSNIHVVRADYRSARADCAQVAPLVNRLMGAACALSIDVLTGRARQSYDRLRALLARSRNATVEERSWVLARLAETAERLGDAATAERHFRQALSFKPRDQSLLAGLADLLLDDGRPAEVISLLRERSEAEHLLLRLVLAEKAVGAGEFDSHRALVAQGFDAARRGGYAVHEGDESRFALHVLNDPSRALALALANWSLQRESRDARAVLEAARAMNDAGAAQPVIDWMRGNDILDVRLARLVDDLLSGR
jgi:tetratricopeptide (TPR) repeat protein